MSSEFGSRQHTYCTLRIIVKSYYECDCDMGMCVKRP